MQNDKPDFGIDAPGVVRTLALVGIALLVVGAVSLWLGQAGIAALTLWPGCSMSAASLLMVLSSKLGKPLVTRRMIARLQLHGDEQVLDVGCGRGQLLLDVARRLPQGRATGLDLWSTRDQSGNAAAATERNADLAGVRERVQNDTGDMRQMPYPDASFDAIVSSLAIHNLPSKTDREQAIGEIARVLKPGGLLALLDLRHTGSYLRSLRANGLPNARRSWPILLMFPWVWIVRASKPS